ncbi:MAG: amidohydrolase family protein [Verrucomicrobia bacterium]|nr:amidohydrolase family protein [Verrucomicrobiota bacterium]
MIIRAKYVWPVCLPPIEDGGVLVHRGIIHRVAPFRDIRTEAHEDDVVDLGESIIIPGLVDAHCHTDYTYMSGRLKRTSSFTAWIQQIINEKKTWTDSKFIESRETGLQISLENGTTTIADTFSQTQLIRHIRPVSLRTLIFPELIGLVSSDTTAEFFNRYTSVLDEVEYSLGLQAGLAPHSLFSTTPEILRFCAANAAAANRVTSIHAAESKDEFLMYHNRSGDLFEWLQDRRSMDDCGDTTPIRALFKCGILSSNCLLIHANYLTVDDLNLLGEIRSVIVHCPCSQAFFGHKRFLYDEINKRGISVCLGTDSPASSSLTPESSLSLFTQMRLFSDNYPGIEPEEIIRMTTLNPARALGLNGVKGELTPGAHADMIALPITANMAGLYEEIVNFTGKPSAVMVGGHWTSTPEK